MKRAWGSPGGEGGGVKDEEFIMGRRGAKRQREARTQGPEAPTGSSSSLRDIKAHHPGGRGGGGDCKYGLESQTGLNSSLSSATHSLWDSGPDYSVALSH